MKKTIAILGCMDTKESEIFFAKEIIENAGQKALIIDMSVKERPIVMPDVTAEEILEQAGYSWEEIIQLDRGGRISMMTDAMRQVIPILHLKGQFDAVFSMGGAQNTMMATAAMRALPYGVPKVMLSTMASGKRTFGPFVDTKDIVIMHSVADISGLNALTENVIRNAVSSVIGMAMFGGELKETKAKCVVGTTMLGITSRGVERAKEILEAQGLETITFHANGVGGKSMEELIKAGVIQASMDLTLHEIANEVIGGYCTGANNRLAAAGEKGIPQVISAGALDMIDFATESGPAGYPDDWESRQHIYHNASIIHMKVTEKEIRMIGKLVGERVSQAKGPVTVLFPLKGFCEAGAPGGAFFNPAIDRAFIETVKENLADHVRWMDVDANINDELFAETAAKAMLEYVL